MKMTDTQIKIASTVRETLLDKDIKEAQTQVSDYVKTRIREDSVAKQIYTVREDINYESPECQEFPELVPHADFLFKGLLENDVRYFVRSKLAKYAQAFEGTFSRTAHADWPRREYAYFPVVRIWTDEITFELERLQMHGDSEIMQEIENDFIFAFNNRLDSVVRRLMDNAITATPANLVVSGNTNLQRSDFNAIIDTLEDQELLADVLIGSRKRFRDIFLYDGTDIGDHAGETLKQGADYYDRLAGLRKVSSITSPIVSDSVLWAMASGDYVGNLYIIKPLTVRTKKDDYEDIYKMRGHMDIAVGLANLKGVAKMTFA